MAAKPQPGIGLLAEWDLGESGWKAGMDENLRRLSGLVNTVLMSVNTPLPSGAADGSLAVSDENTSIQGRIGGQWVTVIQPKAGLIAWDKANERHVRFDGTAWGPVIWLQAPPADEHRYAYVGGEWVRDDYRVNAFIPSILAAGQHLASFIIPVPVTLPGDAADSVARCQVGPPNAISLPLHKNGTPIGSIDFAMDQTVGVINITGSQDVSFAANDELNVFAPATLSGVPEGVKILFRLEM